VQHLRARAAHLQLHVAQAEFFGDGAVGLLHFLGHLPHRLIEAESRFDADDHQVERVGQAEEDRFLALLGQPMNTTRSGK
jgi:hypothetical protein